MRQERIGERGWKWSLLTMALIVGLAPALAETARADAEDHEGEEYFSPEQRKKAEDFARKEFPAYFERIELMKKTDPEYAEDLMKELPERAFDMMEMKEENPRQYEIEKKAYALEYETEKMGLQIREAVRKAEEGLQKVDEAGLDKMRAELRQRLEELFELRMKSRELEAEEIEEELDEVRRLLALRRDHRAQIIERRFNELIGQEDILEW